MLNLELSPSEAELLVEIAEEALWDLRQEVHQHDAPDHRDVARKKEALLEKVLERLMTPVS